MTLACDAVALQQQPVSGSEPVVREGVTKFALFAPGKQSVHLVGDFND